MTTTPAVRCFDRCRDGRRLRVLPRLSERGQKSSLARAAAQRAYHRRGEYLSSGCVKAFGIQLPSDLRVGQIHVLPLAEAAEKSFAFRKVSVGVNRAADFVSALVAASPVEGHLDALRAIDHGYGNTFDELANNLLAVCLRSRWPVPKCRHVRRQLANMVALAVAQPRRLGAAELVEDLLCLALRRQGRFPAPFQLTSHETMFR